MIRARRSLSAHLLPMLHCRRPMAGLQVLTIGAPGIEPDGVGLAAWAAASDAFDGLMARLRTSSPSEKAGVGAWVGAPAPAGLEGRRSLKKSSEAIGAGKVIGQEWRLVSFRKAFCPSRRGRLDWTSLPAAKRMC